jgi:hypothetical protein
MGNRNFGARDGGAGWIEHGTGKLAVLYLRECAEAQSQHGKYCEAKLQSFHLSTPWKLWHVVLVGCTKTFAAAPALIPHSPKSRRLRVYRITCYCGVRKILRLEPLLVNLHFASPTVTE